MVRSLHQNKTTISRTYQANIKVVGLVHRKNTQVWSYLTILYRKEICFHCVRAEINTKIAGEKGQLRVKTQERTIGKHKMKKKIYLIWKYLITMTRCQTVWIGDGIVTSLIFLKQKCFHIQVALEALHHMISSLNLKDPRNNKQGAIVDQKNNCECHEKLNEKGKPTILSNLLCILT